MIDIFKEGVMWSFLAIMAYLLYVAFVVVPQNERKMRMKPYASIWDSDRC